MKSNIYIIGAGAIGKALAVFLKLNKKNVTLLRGSVNDQQSRIQKFRVVLHNNQELDADIEVSTLSNFPFMDGIVVLTNKSFGNNALSETLKGKIKNSPVVILQNGLGVERSFIEKDFPEVYRCVLFVTSQTISETELSFKPVSSCPVGIIKGNDNTLSHIVNELSTAYAQFRAEPDIKTTTWKKAIANCVFNSICPLLDTDNGVFHRDEKALEIATRVIEECVAIAEKHDVILTADQVVDSVLMISKSSSGQLISTLQDIRKGRRTEIETLNFEIARMAAALGKDHLAKETRLLGELVKLKSELHRKDHTSIQSMTSEKIL